MDTLIAVIFAGVFIIALWGAALMVGDKEREYRKRKNEETNHTCLSTRGVMGAFAMFPSYTIYKG